MNSEGAKAPKTKHLPLSSFIYSSSFNKYESRENLLYNRAKRGLLILHNLYYCMQSQMTVFNDLQWKPIPSYNNYEVSNFGQVRNKVTGKFLSQATKKGKHPYQRVHLCQNGKSRYLLVHRLVLEAFVGTCPEGHQCLHLDNNPRNNRLDNLKWGTPVENHSTINRSGERNNRSKLTANDVIFIKEYTGNLKDLANMFDVSYGYITNIRSNITWKHL